MAEGGDRAVVAMGDTALLVTVGDLAAVWAFAAAARELPGVLDVVPAAETVLVTAVRGADLAALDRALRELEPDPAAADPGGADVEIPVVYDGPDLDEVAAHTGLSADEVVAAHTGTAWRVGFGGFAPGFAYLAGGDPRLAVPRRSEPRTRVPAGAVGLAGEFSGVYPRASPGGWQLIGRTDVVLWDAERDPPALLTPGARVRFVRTDAAAEPVPSGDGGAGRTGGGASPDEGAGGAEVDAGAARGAGDAAGGAAGAAPDGTAVGGTSPPSGRGCGVGDGGEVAGAAVRSGPAGGAVRDAGVVSPSGGPNGGGGPRALEVLGAGPLALVQDLGRAGHAAVGVPRSGAADRAALRLANRLVANSEDAAGIEALLGGLAVRACGPLTVALAGAAAPADVDGTPVGHHAVVRLRAGQTLRLGAPAAGLRTYLAVRGGLAVPATLGSRASDTLSGLGPAPLRAGDVLPVGPEPVAWPLVDVAPVAPPGAGPVVLRAVAGPHLDWLDDPASLTGTDWTVGSRSDRVGMRLAGEALGRRDGEVPSVGAVRGAVQVPPGGEPVVFLADHPVTGGYPVAAVVLDADVDRAAQARPGQRISLRLLR